MENLALDLLVMVPLGCLCLFGGLYLLIDGLRRL